MVYLPTDCVACADEIIVREAMAHLVTPDDADEFSGRDFEGMSVWQDGADVVVSLSTNVQGRHTDARDALIEAAHQLWCLSRKVWEAAKAMQ